MSSNGGGSTSNHKAIMSNNQKYQQSTSRLKNIFGEKIYTQWAGNQEF